MEQRQVNEKSSSSKQGIRFNGNQLKLVAVISMLLDHMAYVSFYAVNNHIDEIILKKQLYLDWILRGMRTVGRFAFPLVVVFLIEGAFHTRNAKKYVMRLAGLALVSELPFDFLRCSANGISIFESIPFLLQAQNTIVTLLIGLLMIYGLRWMETHAAVDPNRIQILQMCLIAGCCVVSWYLKSDYDYSGIILIALLYRFHWEKQLACGFGCLWMCVTCAGVGHWYYALGYIFVFFMIYCYDGTRNDFVKKNICAAGLIKQYFYYWFYPVHMLLISGIAVFLQSKA